MEIKLITSNKKQFLDLLLLADEQESMIDKYLERGEMFALYDDGLKAISVVTCEGEGIYEIKNIAVCPSSQRKGYGKRLVDYLFGYYQGRCSVMLVGTGDTPSTLSFYEHCGFRISHRLVGVYCGFAYYLRTATSCTYYTHILSRLKINISFYPLY